MSNITINEYEHNDLIAGGRIVTFDVVLEPYADKRSRTIRVFLPDGYDGVKKYPVLYMHDAQLLFDSGNGRQCWYVDREMKKLAEEGLSAVLVGIDSSMHRGSELCPDCTPTEVHFMLRGETPSGNLFAKFVAEQLKPIIDANFAVLDGAENTGIGGASMGGMIAHYEALCYPEVFGRALIFSPAYSFIEWDEMYSRIVACDKTRFENMKLYIMSGGNEDERKLFTLRSSVRCYEAMLELGMSADNIVLSTDSRLLHHEVSWRACFADAFRFLFG